MGIKWPLSHDPFGAGAAGMKDIDAIVERFMEAEDANFSLFNYVNEVNAEVEKLEEQIAEIKVQPCCPEPCDAMLLSQTGQNCVLQVAYSWQCVSAKS